jgi:hypothetical protein
MYNDDILAVPPRVKFGVEKEKVEKKIYLLLI